MATRKQTAKLKPTSPTASPLAKQKSAQGWIRSSIIVAFSVAVALGAYSYYDAHSENMDWTEALQLVPEEAQALAARDASIFEIRDLPGRGKGVIAARDIEQGELVIRESPLFVLPNKITVSPTELLINNLATVPHFARQMFWNLSAVKLANHVDKNPAHEDPELALAIFQTNAVAASLPAEEKGEASQPGVGIFPRMARLNHACSSAFNVVYSWREHEGVLVVHALKSIHKGEELLTTYGDTKKPRSDRQSHLLEQYDFTCTCAVCSLPPPLSLASNTRLGRITHLYSVLARWQSTDDSQNISGIQAIEAVRAIWAVGEEEGYWSERGRLAADAAWVAAAHHDENATREWAKLAEEWYGYEMGKDSIQVGEMMYVAASPRQFPAWGLREPLRVGGPQF